MSKIIGIDPGLDGGITIMVNGTIINMIQMPVYEETTSKRLKSGKYKVQRHIDCYTLADILFAHKDAKIYMEKVNPFAGMGSASSTRMAISIGRIEGIMIGMGFKYEEVTSGKWQGGERCIGGVWIKSDIVYRDKIKTETKQGKVDTKKTSLNAALRLFPNANFTLPGKRVPHDGLYDSALIAEYGRRQQC